MVGDFHREKVVCRSRGLIWIAEILDFGYPQNTETDTLKMYITTEGVKSERTMEDSSRITMQATGALSWRRSDIRYRKNEAFVDVIEDVNLLMSATGTVLRADVNGQIVMRAYLSGTPECKFGLNDRLLLDGDSLSAPSGNTAGTKATKAAAGSVTLEDCQFHQCVKLGKFDADRIISFVPPDGEFELMRYRATENVNLPFKVHAIVNEVGKSKVEYSIAIKANYGSKLFATNVIVRVPTPLNAARITERVSQGKAKYEPEQNNIVWKIPRFSGQSEYVLSAEASLTSMTNQKTWSRPPLSLSFSLLMFTSSGLLVRYLKVFEKSNYGSVKWVRYMTRAGSYEIRYVLYLNAGYDFWACELTILKILRDRQEYQRLGLLMRCIARRWRHFKNGEAGPCLCSRTKLKSAEASGTGACGDTRVTEGKYVCFTMEKGRRRFKRKAFRFSFASYHNGYVAADHFFLVMPHDRPQHFVCKNTHDLLDYGLIRSCPFLHSVLCIH